MQQQNKVIQKNIIIAGNLKTGKSAWLTRFISSDFLYDYVPTKKITTVDVPFYDKEGNIIANFTTFELPGDSTEIPEIKEEIHGAVIFMDLTKPDILSVDKWARLIHTKYPSLKIVVCGNKCDLYKERIYHPAALRPLAVEYGCFYELSAKSLYNYSKPLEFFKDA